jgi:hypothetical protein
MEPPRVAQALAELLQELRAMASGVLLELLEKGTVGTGANVSERLGLRYSNLSIPPIFSGLASIARSPLAAARTTKNLAADLSSCPQTALSPRETKIYNATCTCAPDFLALEALKK